VSAGRAVVAAAMVALSAQAHELRDDRGVLVEWSERPERIIALSPHLAEIAFAAGAGAQLAAVVRYSDYPEAAQRLPRVGDATRIDIEGVLAEKPDLVFGWQSGNPAGALLRHERLGFRVFVTEPRRLADIASVIRRVGILAHTQTRAEASAAAFEAELQALRARYGARAPVRVFYEIWHRPLLTVNGEHIISDVIALCGGRNVFADTQVLTPAVSLEAVLHARPELILGGGSAMRPGELASEWHRLRPAALRDVPVRFVPPDIIQRQTPRMARGARIVCEHIDEVRRSRALAGAMTR
jgi:iron complex transport system substrate-binding protein